MSAWFQILVAFCVIYHSINGIRISLLDFFPGFLRFQREAIWVQWAVILPLFFMTAALIVLLALRAG
jgi:succinate dehydrogenase/fumarate reductase cytochrome b subunit